MRKSTFIFIILSGLASLCNYIVYPILARILSPNEFVDISVALALFTQLSSFMLSIVALTIGLSKQEGEQTARKVVEKLQAILTHLFVVIIVVFLASSPLFLGRLHMPATLLAPISIMLGLSISMSVISGYLNGKQKLEKLGLSIMFSALLQLLFSVAAAVITKSGAATLAAMAFGSFVAIVLTYRAYRSEHLPRPSSVFEHGPSLYRSKEVRSLVTFTIASSIATLIMNLLLIADLLIISSRQVDAKIYTDMYVISRAVFFAGMLFVWPFLSNIDVMRPSRITGLFGRLVALFIFLSCGAIAIMSLFGNNVLQILLGSDYGQRTDLRSMAVLAIAYKLLFLVISTLTLFFIVVRSYWAVYLPLILTCVSAIALWLVGPQSSTLELVTSLNVASITAVIIGLVGFFLVGKKSKH